MDTDERLLLPVGAFTAVTSPGRPAPTPTTWIPALPAAVERQNGPGIPQLTSHERPPTQTRVTDRIVTVPYYMVNDPARSVAWQIENSPFYRIRRHRQFTLIRYRDNRAGTVLQRESQRVTTGVTESAGDSFSKTTGITVGASIGVEVSASPFCMGVSTSVSASFSTSTEVGYERRRDVSTMVEDSKERGLDIPPRSTGCLWMEQHELEPIRADGSLLSNQASLDFRTDYYVTGEYPGGSGVVPWTADASGPRTLLPASNLPPRSFPGRRRGTRRLGSVLRPVLGAVHLKPTSLNFGAGPSQSL
ncbi:hypothetical protein [Streptosporangium roseum]|uniref:hypothetical protein n=1 Tax=Streptosporangium roseum TaxID=2001 RepID=UPI0018CC2805|nr:hypothetical protein [Streptosporangium roseum]